MSLPPTNTLEIAAEVDSQSTSSVQLGIKGGGGDPVTMSFNGLESNSNP